MRRPAHEPAPRSPCARRALHPGDAGRLNAILDRSECGAPAHAAAAFLALVSLIALTPARAGVEGPGAPQVPAAAPLPPPGAAFDDPVASPLLDRHYQTAASRPPPLPVPPPGREVSARRFAIVHAAGVTPGMRVAAIGVGDGLIAALFARAVGAAGVVYGVDSAPGRLDGLKRVARAYRVPNLVPLLGTADDSRLPGTGIDLAFIDGTERFAHPRALLESIHRALVPYGTLIIVAARPPADSGPPGSGSQAPAGRDALIAAGRAAGFRLVEDAGFLRENDFLRFEKSGDEPDPPAGPTRESPAPTAGRR